MRKDAFKKIIKEAVKEAIREELTTTLMEALLRTNNNQPSYSPPTPINENINISDMKANQECQQLLKDLPFPGVMLVWIK